MQFASIYKISYTGTGIIFMIDLVLETIIIVMTTEITTL